MSYSFYISAGIALIAVILLVLHRISFKKRVSLDRRLRREAEIFDMNPAPVFEVDTAGTIRHYNRAAAAIFGEGLKGKDIHRLVPSCRGASLEESGWAYTDQIEEIISGKTYLFTVKRSEAYKEEEASIFLYGTDITGRKDMEQQLRTLYVAVEQSANTIVITDTDGKITFANKAFERTTGYTVEEAVGKNPKILNSGAQDRRVYDNLWETIASGGVWQGEFLNKRKDGSTYWEEAVITPIKSEEGEIIAYLAVKEDITRRKNAEEEMRRAKQEAETANRLKSEFLTNMSHEIRTPMNAIIGFTDLLLDGEEDGEKRANLNIIKKSGQNLLDLINDILDFSRIEAGKVRIERNNFNLYHTLNHIKSMYDVVAEEKGIDFSLTIGTEVPELVSGDELRLNQILLNIVSNSFKFTEKGAVRIECSYRQPKLFIAISDTGIGIADEKLETIFSPFEQADSTMERQFGGTGLGLAISRRLAALMNGTITVESEVGRGSTFTVQIDIVTVAGTTAGGTGGSREHREEYGEEMVSRWLASIEDDEIRRFVLDGLSELPRKLAKLKDAVLRERKQDIRFIAHDVKGFAGNLRMQEVFERARNINDEADRSETSFERIRTILSDLETIVNSIPKKYMRKAEVQKWTKETLHSGFTILLAEDNSVNQRLIETFLRNIGLDCDTAANGREAIEMLEGGAYDLFLLDMQMPVMDGEETIGYIRNSKNLKNLYVIALTAHAMKGDAQKYIDLGCDDYLSKPLDRRLLYEKVNKQILHKQLSGRGHQKQPEDSSGIRRFDPEEARIVNSVVEELKSSAKIFNPEKITRAARKLRTITDHPAADAASRRLLAAAENFDDETVSDVVRKLKVLTLQGKERKTLTEVIEASILN